MLIRACIFDLGGTIIDRYSLTPLIAIRKAFKIRGINLCPQLIRKDMGLNKMDHINKIFESEDIQKQWYARNLETIDDRVKRDIFKEFSIIQKNETIERMKVIPQTKKCIRYLQDNDILTGVTTGFDYEQAMRVKSLLETYNIYLDSYVSSTCLDPPGRPEPYMIFKNMDNLNIDDPKTIIKIDDTVSGIKEGLNAGCITVAVARWSVNMGIDTYEDMTRLDNIIIDGSTNYSLNYHRQKENLKKCKEILKKSGAHYVIDTLEELPGIIEHINRMDEPNPYKLVKS
jgi:phosphonoacetaldehyde hydrolase